MSLAHGTNNEETYFNLTKLMHKAHSEMSHHRGFTSSREQRRTMITRKGGVDAEHLKLWRSSENPEAEHNELYAQHAASAARAAETACLACVVDSAKLASLAAYVFVCDSSLLGLLFLDLCHGWSVLSVCLVLGSS